MNGLKQKATAWYAFEDELKFIIANCEPVLLMAHKSFEYVAKILLLTLNHENYGIECASVIWSFSDSQLACQQYHLLPQSSHKPRTYVCLKFVLVKIVKISKLFFVYNILYAKLCI